MDKIAIRIVKEYIYNHLEDQNCIPEIHLTILLKYKIIQNRKYLISPTYPNGMYYELTYNGDKREWYLNTYKHIDNQCIPLRNDKYFDIEGNRIPLIECV